MDTGNMLHSLQIIINTVSKMSNSALYLQDVDAKKPQSRPVCWQKELLI